MKISNNGFSMVQIMVAAGMMGVLSLGMMKMMENQKKSQKSIKTNYEVTSFYNEAKGYFSKSSYCLKNFKGEVLNNGDSFEFDELVKPNGRTLYKVGELYGQRSFRLSKIEAEDFESDSEGSGILKLVFTLDKIGKSYGAKSYKRILKLDMQLDDKKEVVACGVLGSIIGGMTGIEGTQKLESVESGLKDLQEGKETKEAQRVEEVVQQNKALKEMQNSIETMRQANEKMKKLLEE